MEILKQVIEEYNLKGMTKYLCKCIGVSTSGYYNYLKSEDKRIEQEEKDKKDFELILKAYNFKRRKKGAKEIKMTLENDFGVIFNLKKIRRLMDKYDLECPIRRANPYKKMMKATQEHSTCKNIVNREFKTGIPFNVLLTDITYIFYGNSRSNRCYLSTIKDAETNEILAYNLSENIRMELVIETIEKLLANEEVTLTENVVLHSDQGVHYTCPVFHKLLKDNNITQSMSRRGNCWDNAPQESFFGHMKDELHLNECVTFEDVIKEIDDYMDYYNNYRYQWDLKRMTPVMYRNHLLQLQKSECF